MGVQLPETDLPIESVVGNVRTALSEHGLAVLTAEPGAGKTTLVPLRLLDEDWLGQNRLLVLEPRRVAARAVARRMAQLLGESVGETIGWRTRDGHKVSNRTRVEVITEGILTRRLQSDPSLPGVGAVLFDEFHERSVHADLGLALALEVRETIRHDLRILVMSATIDAEAVAALIADPVLGNAPEHTPLAPIIACPGRAHPVDVQWKAMKKRDRLEVSVANATRQALSNPGDVLVFLPGIGEIKRTVAELEASVDAAVRPLYGGLSAEEQDAALRSIPGQRRVVVATDVAETSLTVDGIGSVVDSGLARRPRYDPASGLSRLVTVSSSKASADQRAGRAGRLGPGVAIRLWSKIEHAARPRHEKPEILQIDMAPLLLEAMAWGVGDPTKLRLLDPPTESAVKEAGEVLATLGAIDNEGRITDSGRSMLNLPLHPRLAAMVAGVGDGPMAWPAAVLAAVLTERDVIGGRPGERPVDLWTRVQLVVSRDHRAPNADGNAIQITRRRAKELLRRTGGTEGTIHSDDLGRTLSLAYPDRIAQKRKGQGGRFRLRNGIGGEINIADPMAHEDMLVVAEVSGTKRNVRITKAAGIDRLDVELGFASEITERVFFGWDDRRDGSGSELSKRVERRLGALNFGTHDQTIEPSPEVTAVLVERIVDSNLAVLNWTEGARNLQARAALVNHYRPDAGLAPIDHKSLMSQADEVFGYRLGEATSQAHIKQLDLTAILRDVLGWEGGQLLDRLAPIRFKLPGGREVTIDYTAESPRISARAQDLYAMAATPSLVDGAVPLTVELLSPANRAIQITSDLAAFWEGSWADVRKDMAGRYPKHHWPEHPQSG